jgi:hypothetical protein
VIGIRPRQNGGKRFLLTPGATLLKLQLKSSSLVRFAGRIGDELGKRIIVGTRPVNRRHWNVQHPKID